MMKWQIILISYPSGSMEENAVKKSEMHIILQFKKNFFKYAIRRKTNTQEHFANVSLGMKSERSD